MLGRFSISGRSSTVAIGPACWLVEESSGIVAEETLICSAIHCSVICSAVGYCYGICYVNGYSGTMTEVCSAIICFDCTTVVCVNSCSAVGCIGSSASVKEDFIVFCLDGEIISLKILAQRVWKPCSSSESSIFTTS